MSRISGLGCSVIFLVTSLTLAVLSSRRSRSIMELERIKRALPQAQREEMPIEEPKEGVPIEVGEEKEPIEEEAPLKE